MKLIRGKPTDSARGKPTDSARGKPTDSARGKPTYIEAHERGIVGPARPGIKQIVRNLDAETNTLIVQLEDGGELHITLVSERPPIGTGQTEE